MLLFQQVAERLHKGHLEIVLQDVQLLLLHGLYSSYLGAFEDNTHTHTYSLIFHLDNIEIIH